MLTMLYRNKVAQVPSQHESLQFMFKCSCCNSGHCCNSQCCNSGRCCNSCCNSYLQLLLQTLSVVTHVATLTSPLLQLRNNSSINHTTVTRDRPVNQQPLRNTTREIGCQNGMDNSTTTCRGRFSQHTPDFFPLLENTM
jgi:hypothetical protein